jgi:hypothetical protein
VTKQETFDIVARHLLTQNKKAYGPYYTAFGKNNGCVYRSPDGLKCAAGCLIPDDKYHSDLEGEIANLGDMKLLLQELGHDANFVRRLQLIHDNTAEEDWAAALIREAAKEGLSRAVVTELRGQAASQS